MKASELKRWLKRRGCTFQEGTKHTVIFFQDRRTTMPRHPAKELNPNTMRSILRQLGISKES